MGDTHGNTGLEQREFSPKLPLPAWKVIKHHTMRGMMPWDSRSMLPVLVSPMDPVPARDKRER